MPSFNRLILLNQSPGEMFFQLAEGLSQRFPEGCVLLAGNVNASLAQRTSGPALRILSSVGYDRTSRFRRVLSWVLYTLYATPLVLNAKKGDLILTVSNPPLTAPWVYLLTRFRRTSYALLVYDIYPDVLIRLGILGERGIFARIWRAVNCCVYRRAHVVITIGRRMADTIKPQLRFHDTSVAVAPLWADVSLIRPISRELNPYADEYVPRGSVVVLFSGNMGASHDIGSILESARNLQSNKEIFFLLIGGGENFSATVEFAKRYALTNVRVLPWQPEERLPFTLALGDIALVTVNEGMEDLMMPSKTFSYLAAGSAIIAITNEPSELTDLLNLADVGQHVAPHQPEHLSRAILSLAKDKRRLAATRVRARKLAEERFSREAGVAAFCRVLDEAGIRPNES